MGYSKVNVLLITVDALRADHLGCYGYLGKTSPFIDSLASKGALFTQAITNGGGTPEAFPSILASVPPPLHLSQYKTLYKESLTLPEVLKEKGYETAAFHSNPFLSRYFYYHKGFDVFEDEMGKVDWFVELRKRLINMGRKLPVKVVKFLARTDIANPPIVRAEEITKKAISWACNKSHRFFLWVHYMDVHSPRIPPPNYLSKFSFGSIDYYDLPNLYNKAQNNPNDLSKGEKRKLLDLYDTSIRYVDDSISMLCTKLRDNLDDTIIILTSDHGEALGENGVYGHTDILYDFIIRVPLILTGPGIQEKTVVEKQADLMDIAPTVVDLLNFDIPNVFRGKSLVSAKRDKETRKRETISVTIDKRSKRRAISCRTDKYKFIRTETLDGRRIIKEEFYNLKKDPQESVNLIEVESEKALLFLSKIEKAYTNEPTQLRTRTDDQKTNHAKEKLKERLKALGYLD